MSIFPRGSHKKFSRLLNRIMKKYYILLFAFCLAVSEAVQAGLEETIDFSNIEEEGFGATKRHSRYWKCATGFFLSDDGFFATDALTIKDAKDIVVVWKGKAFEADLIYSDMSNRVAVLKVKGAGFSPVMMSWTGKLAKGAKVKAVGCSASDENGIGLLVSDCVVSMKSPRKTKVFGSFRASMSGSPVYDNSGKVAGMLISSGGEIQSECPIVDSQCIVTMLPKVVKERVIYCSKTPSLKRENFTMQTNNQIAFVLVYNDERRMAEREMSTKHLPNERHHNEELTVDKIEQLAPSAKAGKTHLECTGSGFFVSEDGYVLTNYHVVDGAKELMIIYKGKPYQTSICAKSKEKDLALLKVEGSFVPVVIATEEECFVGQTIFVVGYPQVRLQGLEAKVTKGIISSRSGFKGEQSEYQIDAAIQGGNSGGPVADDAGRIVGVCVATLRNGQNVNYAIKWSTVGSFLPKGVKLHKEMRKEGKTFADAVACVIDSSVIILNFMDGGTALDYSTLTPDRRKEVESMIRKRTLYARLAKIKKNWKEVKELTDDVLSIDPALGEAKELNDLARDELGQHLIIIATVEGRDVPAKIEPISGFKDKWLQCGQPIALQPGEVKGRIVWKENGKIWQGEIDCIYNWHGTKEMTICLSELPRLTEAE